MTRPFTTFFESLVISNGWRPGIRSQCRIDAVVLHALRAERPAALALLSKTVAAETEAEALALTLRGHGSHP